ncbi:MAG: helix-turn-helix domain-containing protein [Opitutaceae bacterium]|nr:helix-turn-helix domain-containing protein [Opitutaceae bacterium]
MVTNKLKELEVARAKLANLEQSIADELKKELAALPAQYGFASVGEFIAAVKAAAGARRGRKPGAKNRRRRAVITDEMRQQVKKLLEAGKSGTDIAKVVKISVPSVHNIKKSLGLVKSK